MQDLGLRMNSSLFPAIVTLTVARQIVRCGGCDSKHYVMTSRAPLSVVTGPDKSVSLGDCRRRRQSRVPWVFRGGTQYGTLGFLVLALLGCLTVTEPVHISCVEIARPMR